jgi:hypothetical protein
LRFPLTPIRLTIIEKTNNNKNKNIRNGGEDVKKRGTLTHL